MPRSIGTIDLFSREGKMYLNRAKKLRQLAERDERFALFLTNVAINLEDAAKHLAFLCEAIERLARLSSGRVYVSDKIKDPKERKARAKLLAVVRSPR
jgi:hypothetical protein